VHADTWIEDARASYDRVAHAYADLTRDALDVLPLERALLADFARRVRAAGGGPVVDAGCGPGWITGHLARQGLDMVGLDLSGGLLGVAREHHPDLPWCRGSVTDLPFRDAALAGLVSWFVLHHVPTDRLAGVLAEVARVLAPGGSVLVGGHVGEGSRLKTEGYGGHPMRVLVARRTHATLTGLLRGAGLAVETEMVLDADRPTSTGVIIATRPVTD
jgi:ubiquinone/menaquinone biosynthesis C-methylase UbiE